RHRRSVRRNGAAATDNTSIAASAGGDVAAIHNPDVFLIHPRQQTNLSAVSRKMIHCSLNRIELPVAREAITNDERATCANARERRKMFPAIVQHDTGWRRARRPLDYAQR